MKTRNNFILLCIATLAITATSCIDRSHDEVYRLESSNVDKGESSTLCGQWYGNFGMFYRDVDTGIIYNSHDTDIVFYPDYSGATKGWGREVDRYDNAPYRSIQHKIYWEIVNGIIYLTYPGDTQLSCNIHNYTISNGYFTGWFSNGKQKFTMNKTSSPLDWSVYTTDYSRQVNKRFQTTIRTRSAASADTESEISIECGNHFFEE